MEDDNDNSSSHDMMGNEESGSDDEKTSSDSEESEDSEDSKDSEDIGDKCIDPINFLEDEEMDQESYDFLMLSQLHGNYFSDKTPQRNCSFTGEDWVQFLLNGHPRTIHDMLRMDACTFRLLCAELRSRNLIERKKLRLSVEESVAIFLYIAGHGERQRAAADRFQHSTETINRHFKIIMRALDRLAVLIIVPPNPNMTPSEIVNNPKYYPWFKDCIGAIDGTHIAAHAHSVKHTAYRGRKVAITQNVLAACSFDMKFTFVYPGWEGSAADSRVLLDALERNGVAFPLPPLNKYYVVDAGYTNMPGFLAPYRSERYHLDQFHASRHAPTGPKELFNYRHSSLRNVIERCFGVLKGRFPLLKAMPNYREVRQGPIVTACCACHNWIRMHSQDDPWFGIATNGNEAQSSAGTSVDMSQESLNQMVELRDSIAAAMWNNYTGN